VPIEIAYDSEGNWYTQSVPEVYEKEEPDCYDCNDTGCPACNGSKATVTVCSMEEAVHVIGSGHWGGYSDVPPF
jgi:hypothetical protein